MRRPERGDDTGTILVLTIGFVAVLLLMVAVVVNVSSVILAKRALAAAADGAAVSAAQALDEGVLYDEGLGARIPLDEQEARDRVRAYELQAEQSQPGLRLVVEIAPDGTTAIVRAQRFVELPFGRILDFRRADVRAEARAQAPTVP